MSRAKWLKLFAFLMVSILTLSVLATAFAYSTIPYGQQSDAVRQMQKALKNKGFYSGDIDGKFGPSTKAAVKNFQSSMGLKSDGRPGNKTLTALYEGTTKTLNSTSNTALKQTTTTNPRSLRYGNSGSRVTDLQKALKAAGYFNGTIDGVYGDLTFKAVKSFQRDNKLYADGIAGTKTLAKLNSAQSSTQVSKSMLLAKGSTGEEVKHMQQFLDSLGYTNTDAAGTFGASTETALKNWQSATGKAVTGTFSESDYNTYIVK
ncbi:MAG: peptidoglycan-binding protein [Eubacteriales bacterium]|nr:peptidoglycan-binding protein [Eubacteriales bacterium]